MSTALQEKEEETMARPLGTLVPLIKEELAAGERAGMAHYREVGHLLLEAQQRMKDDGSFYGKGRGGKLASGAWGKWLERINISRSRANDYMRLASAGGSRHSSVNQASKDPGTRRQPEQSRRNSRTSRLIDYLSEDKSGKRLDDFVEADEREAKRYEKEEAAIEKMMAEIVKEGFRVCSKKYHPDHGGTSETFHVVKEAHKRLEKLL